MAELKFEKKTALPGTFTADTVYLVCPVGSNIVEMWVSDSTGTSVKRVQGEDELDPFLLLGMNNG
jgi:hypothetical protein